MLDEAGWERFSESLVMRMPLDNAIPQDALDQIPLKDLDRFIDAALAVRNLGRSQRAGLAEVIGGIEAEVGMFMLKQREIPVATGLCVHDRDLAGLFEIATAANEQGRGYGRRLVLSALKWARLRGARQAWLQVEADNVGARRLYEAIGFRDLYTYHYRQPSDS